MAEAGLLRYFTSFPNRPSSHFIPEKIIIIGDISSDDSPQKISRQSPTTMPRRFSMGFIYSSIGRLPRNIYRRRLRNRARNAAPRSAEEFVKHSLRRGLRGCMAIPFICQACCMLIDCDRVLRARGIYSSSRRARRRNLELMISDLEVIRHIQTARFFDKMSA